MGISILSKKTKKNIRSKDVNDNIKNTSNSKKYKQYSLTCIKFFFHEVNKHKGVMNVVKSTKNIDIPSTPNETTNLFIYNNAVFSKLKPSALVNKSFPVKYSLSTNWYLEHDLSKNIHKKVDIKKLLTVANKLILCICL
jgi:hypothetical protein